MNIKTKVLLIILCCSVLFSNAQWGEFGELISEGVRLLSRQEGRVALTNEINSMASYSYQHIQTSEVIPFLKERAIVLSNNKRTSFDRWDQQNTKQQLTLAYLRYGSRRVG